MLGTGYRKLPNPGREVGVLLDASAQHAGRSGREVLRLTADVLGVDRGRVPELLDRVGLPDRRRRRSASATTRSACASGSASPRR